MAEMDKLSQDELTEYLGGVSYPASRGKLIETAHNRNAPERVMIFLEQIPEDREFFDPSDVSQELSESGDSAEKYDET